MSFTQAALSLDGAPTPATRRNPPLHGGWPASLRHTPMPTNRRIPGDEWDEYRLESEARARLHLPRVGLTEFRDMRDWSDHVEESDDDEWITEPGILPYGCGGA